MVQSRPQAKRLPDRRARIDVRGRLIERRCERRNDLDRRRRIWTYGGGRRSSRRFSGSRRRHEPDLRGGTGRFRIEKIRSFKSSSWSRCIRIEKTPSRDQLSQTRIRIGRKNRAVWGQKDPILVKNWG
ncbi:unnamed protein product [Musa acuminata var. zebrina]